MPLIFQYINGFRHPKNVCYLYADHTVNSDNFGSQIREICHKQCFSITLYATATVIVATSATSDDAAVVVTAIVTAVADTFVVFAAATDVAHW